MEAHKTSSPHYLEGRYTPSLGSYGAWSCTACQCIVWLSGPEWVVAKSIGCPVLCPDCADEVEHYGAVR